MGRVVPPLLLLALTLIAGVARAEAVMLHPINAEPVAGEIIRVDLREVVMKVQTEGGEVERTYAWDRIRKISNGLTRDKVPDWLQKFAPKQRCQDCKGEGSRACPNCKGSGDDPIKLMTCKSCGGSGFRGCPEAKCKDGRIACPEPCVKASHPDWRDGEDGRFVFIKVKNNDSVRATEKDIGLIPTKLNGKWVLQTPCPTCNKAGEITCPTCNGQKKLFCTECKGIRKTFAPCTVCNKGQQPCQTCDGRGIIIKEPD